MMNNSLKYGIEIGDVYDNIDIVFNNLALNGYFYDIERNEEIHDARCYAFKNKKQECVEVWLYKELDSCKVFDLYEM